MVSDENRKWWTLAAVSLGLFMIMLDNTIVNVALPTIRSSLKVQVSDLEWVVTAYALTFGVFLFTGGKLADMYGRRRIFIIGLAVFTVSSLACGLASGAGELIAARCAQGVGAALMNPATLSIIAATFPPQQRGMAIGIWSGVSAVALAIGPLLGGIIVENLDWSWIFYINIPVGIGAIFAARAFITESRDMSAEQRLDLPGLFTAGLGFFALAFGLIESNKRGWGSPEVIGLFIVSAISLVVFVIVEKFQKLPMLDLSFFKNRTFSGANTVMLFVGLAMFGIFFFISIFLQSVLGYSPIETGAAFLPMTVMIVLISPISGRLSDRIGSRWLIGGGMTLLSLSLVLMSRLHPGSTFLTSVMPPLMLAGIGMALTMTPVSAAVIGSVPLDKAGVGSATLNSMRQVGGALGIALMGAVVAGQVSLPDGAPGYQEQFLSGFHNAVLVGAGITFAGAIIGVLTVRKVHHEPMAVVPAADGAGGAG